MYEGGGYTLAYFGAQGGEAEIAKLLLDNGVDVMAPSEEERIPLFEASYRDSWGW